jgi:hypothetical protein
LIIAEFEYKILWRNLKIAPPPQTSLAMASGSQYYQSQDVNPYHQPYQGPSYLFPGLSSAHSAPVPANAYEYDVGIVAQQSVYVPGAMIDKRGGAGGKLAKGGKRVTVLRKGAGKVWEDQTLLEWDPGLFSLILTHHLTSLLSQHGSAYLWVISVTTYLMMCSQMLSTNIARSRRLVLFGID